MVTYDNLLDLVYELKQYYSSIETWTFTTRTYNQIRYLAHVRPPTRKLRKYQERKRIQRLRLLRRRYGI